MNREKSNLEKEKEKIQTLTLLRGGIVSLLDLYLKRINGEVQKKKKNRTTDSCTTHSSVYVSTSMAISNRNFSNDSPCKRYNLLFK